MSTSDLTHSSFLSFSDSPLEKFSAAKKEIVEVFQEFSVLLEATRQAWGVELEWIQHEPGKHGVVHQSSLKDELAKVVTDSIDMTVSFD